MLQMGLLVYGESVLGLSAKGTGALLCGAALGIVAAEAGVDLLMAKPKYCGDNGAMISALAFYRRNVSGAAAMAVDVNPCLEVGG